MSHCFTPHIQSLPDTVPFVGPETLERNLGKRFDARIGANESAFGISPKATAALEQAIRSYDCSWYGDPENFALKKQLARQLNIQPENICVDAGIDSLLGLSIRLFISPQDTVVTSAGAYPTVNYHVNGFGGVIHSVPYNYHHEDTVALAAAAREHKAKLVYLANPDNPMGTCVSPDAITTLLEALPENCLLMLDEAYLEFMNTEPSLPLDVSDQRLLRYRTFSKAYGMAGMRIGYVIAHAEIARGFNKIRNHFGVNRLSQVAALASLNDSAFIDGVKNKVQAGRENIYALAQSLSLPYLSSSTNFVAVDIGCADKANAIISGLAKHGIFMRKPAVAPQNTFIRIGVGTDKELALLSTALPELLHKVGDTT